MVVDVEKERDWDIKHLFYRTLLIEKKKRMMQST
jgi:hypothetical protein